MRGGGSLEGEGRRGHLEGEGRGYWRVRGDGVIGG